MEFSLKKSKKIAIFVNFDARSFEIAPIFYIFKSVTPCGRFETNCLALLSYYKKRPYVLKANYSFQIFCKLTWIMRIKTAKTSRSGNIMTFGDIVEGNDNRLF